MTHGTLVVPHGTLSGECKYSMGIYSLFRQLLLFLFIILVRNVLCSHSYPDGSIKWKMDKCTGATTSTSLGFYYNPDNGSFIQCPMKH